MTSYQTIKDCVTEQGYSYIDCSPEDQYNNQNEIGLILSDLIVSNRVKRESLYIASKIPNDCHRPADARQSVQDSIRDLRLTYLDLVLIAHPVAFNKGVSHPKSRNDLDLSVTLLDTYRALEEMKQQGIVKNVGLCNVNIQQIVEIQKHFNVSVVQDECHILSQNTELREFCNKNNIIFQGYSTLSPLTANSVKDKGQNYISQILQIAHKLKMTPAQLCIQWAIQSNVQPIVKSQTPSHYKQNSLLTSPNEIPEQEMTLLNNLDLDSQGKTQYINESWLNQKPYEDDLVRIRNYKKMDGLCAAALTPFNSDGSEVNYTTIEPYADFLVENKVDGVLVCGTSGEHYSLTLAERKKILEKWMSCKCVVQNKLQILVNVHCVGIKDTIELAKHAAALNVRGIFMMGHPFWNHHTEEDLVDHMKQVSIHTCWYPMLYYHFPSRNNVNINLNRLFTLAKANLPNLVGCKYTHNNIEDIYKTTVDHSAIDIFVGGDTFMLPLWKSGVNSCIGLSLNINGRAAKSLYECVKRGEWAKAQYYQNIVTSVDSYYNNADVAFGGKHNNYIFVKVKEMMKVMFGLDFGGCRSPIRALDQRSKTQIRNDKTKLLAMINKRAML